MQSVYYRPQPGPPGTPGSLILIGAGAPSSGLGSDFDLYLNQTNYDLYQKISGTWGSPLGNIQGPTGMDGTDGATGAPGSQIFTVSDVPDDGTGVDGDLAIDSLTGDYYKKAAGSWGSPQGSLKGVVGDVGPAGPTGPIGPTGPSGSSYTYGRTIFVDTTNGDDTTGTGAIASPVKTIAKAIALLPIYAPIMRVIRLLGPGIYNETLTLTQAGVAFIADSGSTLTGTITCTPAASQLQPIVFEGFQSIGNVICNPAGIGIRALQFKNVGSVTSVNIGGTFAALTAYNTGFASITYTGAVGTIPSLAFNACFISALSATSTLGEANVTLNNCMVLAASNHFRMVLQNSKILSTSVGTRVQINDKTVTPVSGTVTLSPYEQVILYDGTTPGGAIILPQGGNMDRGMFYIKRVDTTSNIVPIQKATGILNERIEHGVTYDLLPGAAMLVLCIPGTPNNNWYIVAEFKPVVVVNSDAVAEGAINLFFTDARAKAATVEDAINSGVTDLAPSEDAVFIALSNKSDVGHTHVASDITDFETATDAVIALQAGLANGLATLDGAAKIPSAQLPSYVDDVLEFADLASFPVTGETGIIYVALDTNRTYRWSGASYIEISPGSSRVIKAGVVDGTSFSGTPKKFDVIFTTPYADTAYVISLSGTDARNYSYESKLATGFTINTNANAVIAGEVSWFTTISGETS